MEHQRGDAQLLAALMGREQKNQAGSEMQEALAGSKRWQFGERTLVPGPGLRMARVMPRTRCAGHEVGRQAQRTHRWGQIQEV